MGIWDETCLICGGPLYNAFNGKKEVIYIKKDLVIKQLKKEYNWLDDIIIITNENKIINNCEWDPIESEQVKCKNKKYIINPLHYYSDFDVDGYGIACHEACYKLIKTKLKHNLIFSDVCRKMADNACLMKKKSIYGIINKYQSQFFDFYEADQQNSWLLQNPINDKQNQKRIIDGWSKLIEDFKKNIPRNSPCESATLFDIGKIMIGYDGNQWIVQKIGNTKKWISHNEKIIEKSKGKSKSKSKSRSRSRSKSRSKLKK
jgi:hypothetical protein